MKILVTRANGLLGSDLVVKLIENSHEVIAIDNNFRYSFNSILKSGVKDDKNFGSFMTMS